MNGAIGHGGREAGGSTTALLTVDVSGALIAFAVVWLALTRIATAAPAASTWSLLPQPASMRLVGSRAMKIADGAQVAVRGADRGQVQPIADRFVRLVADTRGLRLRTAGTADASPAITFEVDPHASVVGAAGYRILVGAGRIRVIARSARGAFYGSVTLWQLLTPPGWMRGTPAEIAEEIGRAHV